MTTKEKSTNKVVSLTNDIAFKIFFKYDQYWLLKIFDELLGKILKTDDIQFVDGELHGEYESSKTSRLYLNVKLPNGESIFIEMQNKEEIDLYDRLDTYISKIIVNQIKRGTKRNELKSIMLRQWE